MIRRVRAEDAAEDIAVTIRHPGGGAPADLAAARTPFVPVAAADRCATANPTPSTSTQTVVLSTHSRVGTDHRLGRQAPRLSALQTADVPATE